MLGITAARSILLVSGALVTSVYAASDFRPVGADGSMTKVHAQTKKPMQFEACLELARVETDAVTLGRMFGFISQSEWLDRLMAIQQKFEECKAALTPPT
jgi:hypothetical protein